jgi:hypothetical protein
MIAHAPADELEMRPASCIPASMPALSSAIVEHSLFSRLASRRQRLKTTLGNRPAAIITLLI